MKYYRIVLGLLALLLAVILCLFTINCASRKNSTQQSTSPIAVAAFKHDWIVIENTRLISDEEFRAFVEKQVKDTGYIEIKYDEAVRLHRTYLARAWVFYEKVKK